MKRYLPFLLIIVFSCSDNIFEPNEIGDRSVLSTTLDSEPELGSILVEMKSFDRSKANTNPENTVLDSINWNNIKKYENLEESNVMYTASVQKKQGKRKYVENIVLYGSRLEPKGYLVRYTPREGWLDNHRIDLDFGEFSGKIEYMTLNRNVYAESRVINGRSQIRPSLTCESVEVEVLAGTCTPSNNPCQDEQTYDCSWSTFSVLQTFCYNTSNSGEGGGTPSNGGGGPGSGGPGNGGGDEPILVPIDNVIPCPGDPLPFPEVLSSGVSGKTGGTFGCTRIEKDNICDGIPDMKMHEGIDLKADPNTPVFSMHPGLVIDVDNNLSSGQYEKGTYGNWVILRHIINGVTSYVRYAHLNEVYVSKGATVISGQIIGLAGTTGNVRRPAVKPHLHIQSWNVNWQSTNPENLMNTKFDSQTKETILNLCNINNQ